MTVADRAAVSGDVQRRVTVVSCPGAMQRAALLRRTGPTVHKGADRWAPALRRTAS